MRPSLPRLNPSPVRIRPQSREAEKALDCLPGVPPTACRWLSVLAVGVWRCLPDCLRSVNPPFLAALGLGGERGGRQRRRPGPPSLPGCGV